MNEETPPIELSNILTKDVFNRYLSEFPLIFLSSDGVIQTINSTASGLLGYSVEESIGMNVEGYFQFLGIPLRSYDQKMVFEALVNRKDSSVFPAQVHVIPYTENGALFILIPFLALEQKNKEKNL